VRLIYAVLIAHALALGFGLAGLLIAVPNPQLWADSQVGVEVYRFGMRYAGGLHIVLAAIAMLLVGARFLGWRPTLSFFGLAAGISLGAELIGTTTGFPFGEYSYTSGLGYKVAGEVPFTIPLSWFYMGFASFLLACFLIRPGSDRRRWVGAVALGAFLLTSWDLVLDPAMAHTDVAARFWVWGDEGAYFGMPVQNFAGWYVTGFAFIGLSALAWRGIVPVERVPATVPYLVFMANLVFALVISAAVGLWWPVLISGVLAGVPATWAFWSQRRALAGAGDGLGKHGWRGGTPGSPRARKALGVASRLLMARRTRFEVEGSENVPAEGPVILVARHYHHFYDGAAIMAASRRPVHILVALDWVRSGLQRRVMELACRVAGWPVVLRRERLSGHAEEQESRERSPYRHDDLAKYLLRGWRGSLGTLTSGGVLLVFPEAYPTIDPHHASEKGPDGFLPFRPGFARLAEAAERRGALPVAIVACGFAYEPGARWRVTLRFAPPVYRRQFASEPDLIASIETAVRASSGPRAQHVVVPGRKVREAS
jgi:carotene biosynthesis associated membrane protein